MSVCENKIKVSIVVPVYNAEKDLKKCLDSVVNQTLKEIEIILIDDGSIDSSADICKKYMTDNRVSYYYKENEGLAVARQDGTERARGEFVCFVDSDDVCFSERLEKQINYIQTHQDIIVCGTGQSLSENGRINILTIIFVGKHPTVMSLEFFCFLEIILTLCNVQTRMFVVK